MKHHDWWDVIDVLTFPYTLWCHHREKVTGDIYITLGERVMIWYIVRYVL